MNVEVITAVFSLAVRLVRSGSRDVWQGLWELESAKRFYSTTSDFHGLKKQINSGSASLI